MTAPDRGFALRLWLEQWATERLQRSHGEFDDSAAQAPIPSVPAVPAQTLESPSARLRRQQQQQQPQQPLQESQSSQQFQQRAPSPSDQGYDDDGSQIPAFQIPQPPNSYLSQGSSSPRDDAHAHDASAAGGSPGARCLACRKKDLTIKKLAALIANLLEQVDDLALEARGDLTLIMSAAAAQQ